MTDLCFRKSHRGTRFWVLCPPPPAIKGKRKYVLCMDMQRLRTSKDSGHLAQLGRAWTQSQGQLTPKEGTESLSMAEQSWLKAGVKRKVCFLNPQLCELIAKRITVSAYKILPQFLYLSIGQVLSVFASPWCSIASCLCSTVPHTHIIPRRCSLSHHTFWLGLVSKGQLYLHYSQ